MIPYGRQEVTESDVEAVANVLRSDFLTQGPAIECFEASVASFCGVGHAVAVSSGTAALHLAYRGAGLSDDDILWTSPITFVATTNAALLCGASVDFVDIEPDTGNMSAEVLADRLARASRDRRLPSVVVPVHFAGASCDMAAIGALSAQYGFEVVEDASHAIGGRYRDRPVGSCDYSFATVFSFHPVKIVTTGEGGVVATNDAELADRVALLRNHGITRDEGLMENPCQGPWYYEQIDLGLNYRMTDIQAALGTSQMSRIESYVARRNELAAHYEEELAGLPLTPLVQCSDVYSAFHLYVVCLEPAARKSRAEVFCALQDAGVGVNVHYIPVHLQPYYRRLGFGRGDFPEAERYYERAITLPLYPTMTESDQETVIAALRSALA